MTWNCSFPWSEAPTLAAAAVALSVATAGAQQRDPPMYPEMIPPSLPLSKGTPPPAPGKQGSANVRVLAHLPLGGYFRVSDIDIEQELARPYAYVSRMLHPTGTDIIDLKQPTRARVIYSWRIENGELHQGSGAMKPQYFKHRGRYYLVQSLQFTQDGPDNDVGAVALDVTGLPDTTGIKEVARIRAPDTPGGFHNIFAYKHSDGRALLFATTQAQWANMYDLEGVLGGSPDQGLLGRIPNPGAQYLRRGYHDFYVGYDPATHQDKFYGAGFEGYYVFDVTVPKEPKLLTSVTGAAGIAYAHTFTPTPDGRYAVAEAEYQFAPLRIFDLKPGLDGQVKTISRPIGAWTADWQNLPHNHEVRWPYVFVSTYEDGLYVFNMMDPTNPYTVGYYDAYDGPHHKGYGGSRTPEGTSVSNGTFGLDVRNADGLIVISDSRFGFWAFHLDGFDGWNGHSWGMPNVSSAQDWDNGPDGAPKPRKAA